jgi:pimeloyl-ACP methyl ester carboxylesterase
MRHNKGISEPPRRSGAWMKWLALAGAGVAGALVVHRLLEMDERPPRGGEPEPEPADAASEEPPAGLHLPADVVLSHIPGRDGSLRVAERHPTGTLPILFVHGLGGRLEQWAPVLARLGPALRGIAFDLPGHGESDPPADGEHGVGAQADAIGAVAAALGLRRFVLVGHSLGGLIAIDYAGRHPDRVLGLLLADPNGDATLLPQAERESLVRAVEEDAHGELGLYWRDLLIEADGEVASRVRADLERTDAGTLAAGIAAALDCGPLPAFDAYPGPKHAAITAFNLQFFNLPKLRPELTTTLFGDTSHWLMMDRPDQFCAVLWDFLERVRR